MDPIGYDVAEMRREVQRAIGILTNVLSRLEPPIPKPQPAENAATGYVVDDRSALNIRSLLPAVQAKARELLAACAEQGITAKIISGTRTYEEQDAIYAQGRTRPGKIVTKAKAGHSNHNFGIAFDIGIFSAAGYQPESPLYAQAGAIGKRLGISWGGDWKFEDQPHFELHPPWAASLDEGTMLAQLRVRHDKRASIWS